MQGLGSQGHVSTTGVHKSEKKEVCGQPAAEARARARDGSTGSRRAQAEQGEAGSDPVTEKKKKKKGCRPKKR
jgi:hypothetical protein